MTVMKTQGTVLKWNNVAIGNVTNISGLSSPSNKINITTMDDTVMTYRPGRRKAGNFTFDVDFDPDLTVQGSMETDRQAGTERTVVLVGPSGTIKTITFSAKIMNITISASDDDVYKSQITLKITSIPVRS